MEAIFAEVQRALQAGSYYAALVTSLSLPDICAALESDTGDTTGKSAELYKKWCSTWLIPLGKVGELTEKDIYALRCGVMHQGRVGHPNMQYDRLLFKLPDAAGSYWNNVVFENNGDSHETVLMLDVLTCCNSMIAAAQKWYDTNGDSTNVQKNLPQLVQYRPMGLAPHVIGVPVIA